MYVALEARRHLWSYAPNGVQLACCKSLQEAHHKRNHHPMHQDRDAGHSILKRKPKLLTFPVDVASGPFKGVLGLCRDEGL